jgi:ribosomal protein S18 acetylase RimI-like enzyme
VHPAHRGNGVGRTLLERSRVHAQETGAGGLSLATQRNNLPAQRLYESLHWQRDDEFFHYELTIPDTRRPSPTSAGTPPDSARTES